MSYRLQTLSEDEEYNWTGGDRRPGRDIIIAVDHGPKSKHAFDWALNHLCRAGDTLYLVHSVSSYQGKPFLTQMYAALPGTKNSIVYDVSQTLMEKLTREAAKVAMAILVSRTLAFSLSNLTP